jgi:hypothetical protein
MMTDTLPPLAQQLPVHYKKFSMSQASSPQTFTFAMNLAHQFSPLFWAQSPSKTRKNPAFFVKKGHAITNFSYCF